MGQSFNPQGILQSFRVLISPRLMVPNLVVRDIRDINFEQLRRAGIVAIAFDKDNCLTRPYGLELYPPFTDAWKRCKDVYKDRVVVVSNSAGTKDDKDYKEADTIERSLKVHVLRHQEKKPGGGEELLSYLRSKDRDGDMDKESVSLATIEPSQIAVVGDRALTDVVFGNTYGMLTILTKNVVTEEGDNPMAIQIRRMEHKILLFLERLNIQAEPHPFPVDPRRVVYAETDEKSESHQ